MTFRRGRRVAVDVGTVRVGVAACDPDGILASPVGTLYRREGDDTVLRQFAQLIEEYEPIEIISGKPTSLDGKQRASAHKALAFTEALSRAARMPIKLMDERFSTSQAHAQLAEAGRNSKQRREIVDAQAAVIILQSALEYERANGPLAESVGAVEGQA
ncbi:MULTISPECIES: Holliday junction resolvase RuvX [unclassified Brevibacterium]|uniref:Holliday junction resolvase RuvX n=1 Tax=unclassified Brevibacterium TaxID=2614124 RepID=UPI0008A2BF55|nr:MULTISPECIES: Holliday junction resolvase RuvX [unclassified Brevibacterium]OFL64068.1 crossover junction endodeoxyribonuclease RuvA [Brevibacterium sp. HMSC063G07]OFS27140.1 crossover junction endodeoxyribonuclease RuvA [Brevibacterium sp. HMSC07C04]